MSNKPTHQDLLRELISQIREKEVPFYRKQANANYVGWYFFVALSIVLSASASLLAALTPADQLQNPWIRGLLIGLPIIGTTVSTFLRSFSFNEREKNREIGFIEAERLLRLAESRFASANTEEDYKLGFLEVTHKLATLSHDQHVLDVATRKGIQMPSVNETH